MKTVKVKISIAEYLKLGGTIESLIGQDVFKTQGDHWYAKKILDASSRVITKGKRKGEDEITITVEYTYIYNNTSTWVKKATSMDKHFIYTDVILAQTSAKLNDVTTRLLSIPTILNQEFINIYEIWKKPQ